MAASVSRVGPYIVSGKVLGTGTTSTVKMAFHQDTGQEVALKIIPKASLVRHHDKVRVVQREIAVMKLLSHPNVLELIDVYESEDSLYLVQEYVSGGELFGLLYEKGAPPPDIALKFFYDLLEGLYYCHSHLICHRDLKPENLLLMPNAGLKIADFGMARLMSSDSLQTSCGSPHYAAPEIVRGDAYDGRKTDAWSCGVILFALFSGKLPFDDPDIKVLLGLIKMNKYIMPAYIPRNVQDLIRKLLVTDPLQRYSIDQCRHHPIMAPFYPTPPVTYPSLVERYAFRHHQQPPSPPNQESELASSDPPFLLDESDNSTRSDSDPDSASSSESSFSDEGDGLFRQVCSGGCGAPRRKKKWDSDVVSTLSSLGCGPAVEVELALDTNSPEIVTALYQLLMERKLAASNCSPTPPPRQQPRRPKKLSQGLPPLNSRDLGVDLSTLKDRGALDTLVSPHSPSPIALMAQRKRKIEPIGVIKKKAERGRREDSRPADNLLSRSNNSQSPSLPATSQPAYITASPSSPREVVTPRLLSLSQSPRSSSPRSTSPNDQHEEQLTPRRRSGFRLFSPPRLGKSPKTPVHTSCSSLHPIPPDRGSEINPLTLSAPPSAEHPPPPRSIESDSEDSDTDFSSPPPSPSSARLRSGSFGISMRMFRGGAKTARPSPKPWEGAHSGISLSAGTSASSSSSSTSVDGTPSTPGQQRRPPTQIRKAAWFPSFFKLK